MRGLVGLGNAALSPLVTKACIDTYLKPLLLGADPWDTEYLWQQMYRRTMAFGRKGVAMTAISAVDIALVGSTGKIRKTTRVSFVGRTNEEAHSRLRQPSLQHAARGTAGLKRSVIRTKDTKR